MLCLSGFELYSRGFRAVTEQKTRRNESQRPHEKWGAYSGGDAAPRACSHFLIYWLEKIFFSNSLCTYQSLHVFCQQKVFLAGFARPVKNKKIKKPGIQELPPIKRKVH